MRRRDLLKAGMAALSAQALPRRGFAQAAYPDRPVRLIVPFPPGGAFDTVGRPWADRIKPHLGTVVIENIGGAGGGVGAAQAARSRPDGYTLLLGGATTHITEALLKTKPTFDPLKDLEPISPIAVTAFAIAVHPSVPANNLKELVAYVKANPGQDVLRLRRPRLAQSSHRRTVQAQDRAHRFPARAVSRRGAGADRSAGRADSRAGSGDDQYRGRSITAPASSRCWR